MNTVRRRRGTPHAAHVPRWPAALRWNHENRLLCGALLVALPALAITLASLPRLLPPGLALAAGGGLVGLTLALAAGFRRRMAYPLYTLANLLEALREGDYSLRGSRAAAGDAIGEVVREINTLADTLRQQRLGFEEQGALLAKVVETLDIAVLSFDGEGCLGLANPAAERLLAAPVERLAGRSAQALGLAAFLDGGPRVVEHAFPGGSGRWEVRHARFRDQGRPHELLVVSDLSRALREEEREAWQRLLRVLGHELNNSLAPIRSMAATLARLSVLDPPPEDWREDLQRGLGVIGDRAEALTRFMGRYTQLAKLPPPTLRAVAFSRLARQAAQLEQRLAVGANGPEVVLEADPDQLGQVLVNLVRNAADAALEGGGTVDLIWWTTDAELRVEIRDDGPGLPTSGNLFVPFFTTKPGGSGIGLVLSRQIIEAHGGRLVLEDRSDSRGCVARLVLPLAADAPQ